MATIVGAIVSSHTPTIGFALDTHKQSDRNWAPIFEGYEPIRQWLAVKKPDVLVFIFNDHVTSFFFDHYSHFALGIGDSYAVAVEGGGPRKLPPVKGHPKLAAHIAAGLVADEFDLSFFQSKNLASVRVSTIRNGIWSLWTSSKRILKASRTSQRPNTRGATAGKAARSSCGWSCAAQWHRR